MLVPGVRIGFGSKFTKKYRKLNKTDRDIVNETLREFRRYPNPPFLGNHKLEGKWKGYRSISVRFDLRIVFREIGDGRVEMTDIGTHSDLYG